jgi:predicted HicB family RNase H-like nuclease
MKDMMSYKGYCGSVHYSDEDQVFHGKLEFIRSLVSYEGTDVKMLRAAFEEAVEDYIRLCQEEDREPETPFKGSFNVRTGPDLHRRAALFARSKGLNLNTVVTEALETYLPSSEGR